MDKRAKNILFQTYWKNGWLDDGERITNQQDFQYAKEKGLMFNPLTISHDDCVAQIIEILSNIKQDDVACAFLSSLSTRRLELRSGIASWFVAQQLKPHTYTPVASGTFYENGEVSHKQDTCSICRDSMYGVIGDKHYRNEDLNVLNFERIKWGGVRHGQLLYTLFDLGQFLKEDYQEPNTKDVSIFRDVLKIIEESAPTDYPGKLRDRLSAVSELKSTKDERSVLIEILACIGVLKPLSCDRSPKGKHDWTYAEYWRGEDKFDKETVKRFFGKYL